MADDCAVRVNNLKKKYPGTAALMNINLSFPAGKITGLIGPNGSGKSTLLKSIAGLTRPTGGEIKIFGKKRHRTVKEEIAFLPEINYFYQHLSIKDTIELFNSQFKNFDVAKAEEITDFMELNMNKKIKNLSKGMVGRVKLIVTMSRQAPLIIMDEPLAGIDPKSRAQILEGLINEYNADKQTIILSTHEVLEAEKFFDYVIFLEQGKVKLEGNADDLRKEYCKSIQDLTREVLI